MENDHLNFAVCWEKKCCQLACFDLTVFNTLWYRARHIQIDSLDCQNFQNRSYLEEIFSLTTCLIDYFICSWPSGNGICRGLWFDGCVYIVGGHLLSSRVLVSATDWSGPITKYEKKKKKKMC